MGDTDTDSVRKQLPYWGVRRPSTMNIEFTKLALQALPWLCKPLKIFMQWLGIYNIVLSSLMDAVMSQNKAYSGVQMGVAELIGILCSRACTMAVTLHTHAY